METKTSPKQTTKINPFLALKFRNFSLMWWGSLLSGIGNWVRTVALGYLVYQLTGNTLSLGMVGAAHAIPNIFIYFLGGILADRSNRRNLLIFIAIASMLLSIVLAVLVQFEMIEMWHIILLSALGGILSALEYPARAALLPQLVPMHVIPNASSLNSMIFTISGLIGGALAVPLISYLGLAGAFYVDAISFIFVLISLFAIRISLTAQKPPLQSGGGTVVDAFRVIFKNQTIRGIIFLAIFPSFFLAAYTNLLPKIANHAGGDLGLLGALSSLGAFGTLLGGSISTVVSQKPGKGKKTVLATIFTAVSVALLGLSKMAGLTLLFQFLAGMAMAVYWSLSMVLIQLNVPDEFRGRILSVYFIGTFSMPALASFPLGYLVDLLGVASAFLTTSVMGLISLLIIVKTSPKLLQL